MWRPWKGSRPSRRPCPSSVRDEAGVPTWFRVVGRIALRVSTRRGLSSDASLFGTTKGRLMSLVIILNHPPYGNETTFNALRLAMALQQDKGAAELSIFLLGDSVSCAIPNQMTPRVTTMWRRWSDLSRARALTCPRAARASKRGGWPNSISSRASRFP